ncbi:MAG: hypothetical protein ACWGN1_07240 [Desulfobulbales bacterium]
MADRDTLSGWQKKLLHEMTEYWTNFIYLAIFFSVFITYRRLLMAEYNISYSDYGISVIKALILAKVIMIGDMFRFGRWLEDKPLIFPTIYKTVVFTLFVLLFSILESTVSGLLHGKGMAGGLPEILGGGRYELLGRSLIVFCAFLPFFAFRELGRILGKGRIRELFLYGENRP